jgi:hypothetical protein
MMSGTVQSETASISFKNNFRDRIMSTILQDLEATISGLKTDTTRSNVGTVREIGDGVAKIEGLSDVMLNEMIEFPRLGLPEDCFPFRWERDC